MIEYEFTLPDGTKRYEFVEETADMWQFVRLHKATAAIPVKEKKRIAGPRIADLIAVNGSHGCFRFSRATGEVLTSPHMMPAEYADIICMDLPEHLDFWRPHESADYNPGSIDILDLGYWTKDGTYEPAEEDWRREAVMPYLREQWNRDAWNDYVKG